VVQLNRQGYLLLWRWAEGEARKAPLSGVNIRSRALSPDGLFVAQAHNGETELLSVDLAAGQVATVAQFKQPGKVGCLALSRGGRRLCAGSSGGALRVYDTATQAIVCEQKLADTPTHVALAEDGLRVAVFTQRDGLKLIDLATGEQQPLWPSESERVRCMRFTSDGTRLLAGMNDHTARVWAVTDGRPLLVIDFDHSLSGIAWSEERQLLAVAGGVVKLWRCNFGAKMPEFGLKTPEEFKPLPQ
jgi:WD40 repeat protein